jgi:phage terminase small subunit
MAKRGRKSGADLTTVRVDGQPNRLKPPPSFSTLEAEVFRELVAACDARHFTRADLPLLAAYCAAVVLERRATRELQRAPVEGGKMSPWALIQEKQVRALVSLSLRLRLCPSARTDPRTAARRANGPRPSPLHRFLDDWEEETDG